MPPDLHGRWMAFQTQIMHRGAYNFASVDAEGGRAEVRESEIGFKVQSSSSSPRTVSIAHVSGSHEMILLLGHKAAWKWPELAHSLVAVQFSRCCLQQSLTVESSWHSINSSEKIRILNSSTSLTLSLPVKPTYRGILTQATSIVSTSLLILENHKLSVNITLATSALQRKVDEPLNLQFWSYSFTVAFGALFKKNAYASFLLAWFCLTTRFQILQTPNSTKTTCR